MKVLVTGATGTVGRLVVQGLRAQGAEVFAVTRSADRAKALPSGVEPVVGNLLEPAPLRSAFKAMDALYLLVAGVPSEAHEGLTAVALAHEAGIKRIVYLTVQQNAGVPRHVPHIGAKLLVEQVIRESGIPFTFIQPNFFMQNDCQVRDLIVGAGLYPFPLGDAGASCCDARDIADASVRALTGDGHEGKAYTVAGPAAVTGPEIAALWSGAIGRPVHYIGHDDMLAWEAAQVQAGLAPWQAFDWNLMFKAWQKGLIATPQELEQVEKLLGRPPRSYPSFVTEMASQWASEASTGA